MWARLVNVLSRSVHRSPNKPHHPCSLPKKDIMGSSADAGSGEFHVYHHIHWREYVQQDYLDRQAEMTIKDQEFQESLEKNRERPPAPCTVKTGFKVKGILHSMQPQPGQPFLINHLIGVLV
uniref:Uncharacterized protein n=1 Tax=Eptatretus burgeri TaxID=7764 RepID=A0A8C4Q9T9_EPTBU